ncbi:hypothetical protein Lal_00015457 [Lupinus albus]|nr:hypothetical protein Lal_00015457 [Lupinus albus]
MYSSPQSSDALPPQPELKYTTHTRKDRGTSNLLDRDIASKSDPMVVVYSKKKDGIVEELGRTEVILNYLNPQWIQKINVTFQFEIVQQLEFHVYDVDTQYHCIPTKALKLRDQDFLGMANCTLSEIVTKQSQRLTLKLQSKNGYNGSRNLGTLNVHAEKTISSRNAVEMIFSCTTLDNKDIFSKTDPFIRISRIVESGGSVPICKTEVIDNNLNPTWKPLRLSSKQFGSKENPLIIECFDFNSNGNHVLVGDAAWDWHGTNQVFTNSLTCLVQSRTHLNLQKKMCSLAGRHRMYLNSRIKCTTYKFRQRPQIN